MNARTIIYWSVRIIAAVIMTQTLYFKFTGAEESKYIFSTVGMEPWGRIGVGIFELVASVLLLINTTAWIGALIAIGLMGGAMMMHITILGIVVQDDHGQLFLYAVIVTICSLAILLMDKEKVLAVSRLIFSRRQG